MPPQSLKVGHAVGWYFPESTGGTEVYVEALTRHLGACGIASTIFAASDRGAPAKYHWHDVPVWRYPVPAATRRELVAATPPGRLAEFAAGLRTQALDVYHQHSWTRGCGQSHLRVAKALGLPTVVTVHVPGALCLRGTMMLHGTEPCDGRIEVDRCTRCWGARRGIPAPIAGWQATHPATADRLARLVPSSRWRTALLTPSLVARHQTDVAELGQSADRVVAVSRWLYDALARNGIPQEKLVYCAQGIDGVAGDPPLRVTRSGTDPLRIGFLGRWDAVKGVHVLVDAFRQLPANVLAELIIHGLPQDAAYERSVRARAKGDPRIQFATPVEHGGIAAVMASFDLLAVPSLWLETGPLVVLEAMAVGTPVLGSNLGGIAELITPDSGCLLPAGDVPAWSRALAEAARTRGPRRVPSVSRSSRQVADEMAALYRRLVVPSERTTTTTTGAAPAR